MGVNWDKVGVKIPVAGSNDPKLFGVGKKTWGLTVPFPAPPWP